MKKLSLFLLVGIFVLFFTACDEKMDPNNPQSVRRAITKQQIAFTPNQFVSYAVAGDTAKMTLFLQAAFEIDRPDDNGNNAVAMVVNQGKLDVLTYLFSKGAKANVFNSKNEHVVDNAVVMGHHEILKLLISQLKKEDVELANITSAVVYASKIGATESLKILGDAGVPLETRGADGYFPIHLAVKGGHYDAMMYLISKGVDLNVTCNQKYSVLDWAKNEGYTRLISALRKAGAKHTPAYLKEFGR
ncbi:MAG TPA: ankyrin repeat domain-containing protein [Fibrobacter sp.]|nr:ankyrin repeat domain-containing protein [Fibrobacter sp.]